MMKIGNSRLFLINCLEKRGIVCMYLQPESDFILFNHGLIGLDILSSATDSVVYLLCNENHLATHAKKRLRSALCTMGLQGSKWVLAKKSESA